MSDTVGFVSLVVAFALAVTTHVAIAVGLALRSPRWRGAAAFVVPPLAPYWALQNRMFVRGALWLVAVVGYIVVRLAFRR